ncbi:MAG: hypothetical protein PHH26_00435 [Candidatus Thermoplasmatota archaeon]|nr:hypothetical protein [Candidatus Thermoplasmatota archaeon]
MKKGKPTIAIIAIYFLLVVLPVVPWICESGFNLSGGGLELATRLSVGIIAMLLSWALAKVWFGFRKSAIYLTLPRIAISMALIALMVATWMGISPLTGWFVSGIQSVYTFTGTLSGLEARLAVSFIIGASFWLIRRIATKEIEVKQNIRVVEA